MSNNSNRPLKAFFGCGGVSLFLLTVVLLALTLACSATVAVPFFDKQIQQEIACPPGTTLVTEWIETTYTRPGEKVLSAYCLDAQGNKLQTQDLGYGALKYFPKYFWISLAVSFGLMILVIIPIIILYQIIKRKFFSKPTPPGSAIGNL